MNELKPEDVMRALECCSDCECYNARLQEDCPHSNVPFCKNYLRKQALALLREKDATLEMCAETIERQDKELAKKDAEIERLKKERDLANAEREANVKGFTSEVEKMNIELQAMRGAANSLKMHLETARAEAITEFANLFDKAVSNTFVHYGWYIKQIIIPKIAKEMGENNGRSQMDQADHGHV